MLKAGRRLRRLHSPYFWKRIPQASTTRPSKASVLPSRCSFNGLTDPGHIITISCNLTHLLRTPPPFGTKACSFIEGSTFGRRAWNETPSVDLHWEQTHASHRQQAHAHVRVRPAKSVRYQRHRSHPRTLAGGNRRGPRGRFKVRSENYLYLTARSQRN